MKYKGKPYLDSLEIEMEIVKMLKNGDIEPNPMVAGFTSKADGVGYYKAYGYSKKDAENEYYLSIARGYLDYTYSDNYNYRSDQHLLYLAGRYSAL